MKWQRKAGEWAFESYPGVMFSAWTDSISGASSEKQVHYGTYWIVLEQANYKILKAAM